MYLFIYKTSHKNGKFYIGRHQTQLLEDNYFGSGKWVKSIKDKTELTREILEFTDSLEKLYELEEYYIKLHWDNPLCMNYKRSSNGWSSKDISEFNLEILENGKNRSSNRSKKLYESGKSGLLDSYGKNIVYSRTETGLNPFFKRSDGSSVAMDRVLNGNHNLIGGVTCVDKNGKIKQISKEQYYSQTKIIQDREYVSIASNEGRKRTGKTTIQLVSCINKNGIVNRICKLQFDSQIGKKSDLEWVSINSKEGKLRKLLNVV